MNKATGLEKFRNKKVIITGGLGFIGSNLAHRLVEYGAQVLLVDSLIPEYGGNLFNIRDIEKEVEVNIADVRDIYSMRYLIKGKDYLFNLAGQTAHADSMVDPYTDLEINCRAQLSILETCRHYNPSIKIVFASTRQMYGVPDYLPVDERHLLHPTDVNGINKMAGEWYHILYNNVYGIRSCSLRLTNTYGPRMRVKDARQTFLGIWIKQLISGEEIKVFGDGRQLRDFNFVEDIVDAFLMSAIREEAYGQIFNTGCNDHINLKDLAALLIKINKAGSYSIVPFPPERKQIDIGDYYGDYGKIRSLLGWEPGTSIEDGLAASLEYYRKYGSHYWDY
ncbi:MAG: NAD-dependent epimerase/dehydratase family protein [Nitrospirae bacterium]|nr:NAD-dependent epimerase/dehydratase family protein [Nitrospirota bacterium]